MKIIFNKLLLFFVLIFSTGNIFGQICDPNGWHVYVNGEHIPRKISNKTQKSTIDLDATGRVFVQLHLVSNARKKGRKASRDSAIIDFQLLHKSDDSSPSDEINPIENQFVRLTANGGRKCRGNATILFPKPFLNKEL